MFTSKEYLAKAVEYGNSAKTFSGSSQNDFQKLEHGFFQELERKFTVLAVLADNDQLLAAPTRRNPRGSTPSSLAPPAMRAPA
jgi:hypothetical protein